ncbi:MAG: FecR domain-containing protein [Spirochaetaceae bacterium]
MTRRKAGAGKAAIILLLLLLLTAVAAPSATAAEEVGRIVYLEGNVTLFQRGEEVYADMGTPVYAGDLLRTGPDGFAELEVQTGPSTIVVAEDTALHVRRQSGRGRTETTFELLRGDLDAVVQRLTRDEALSVKTATVALGVRGTEFKVRTSPDDSMVVGITEGSVQVERDREQVLAEAGSAVESVERGRLNRRTVDSQEMDAFLSGWQEARLEAFRSGADTFIVAYAKRYEDQRPRFDRAHRAMAAHAEELERAAEEGSDRGRGELFRLRTEVSGPAVQLRGILPAYEHTFYRLEELAGFHDEGIGRTGIDRNLDSQEFFARWKTQRSEEEAKLANARYLLELYRQLEERSMGGLPSGDSPLGDSPFGEDGPPRPQF